MMNPPYLLLIGFNEYFFQRLETQITSYGLNVTLINEISSETIADVIAIFIDFDSQDLDEKLSICSKQLPKCPVIALSNTPVKIDNIKTLKRPLNVESLRLTLIKLGITQNQIEQKPNTIRAVYSNPESTLHYPVKNSFQDHLIQAWKLHLKIKQPLELIFLSKPVLVIFDGKISGSLSNQQLQKLCDLTINDHSISTVLTIPPKGSKTIEATYFIAKIVLWSSRGRLPEGVNSTDLVQLQESDQLYSLPKIEDSQLIHKLWSMEICSLQKTEHILGISQSHLFSYFSVMYALDLIEIFPSNSPPKTKKKDNKQTSKLEWLGKRLFSKKKLVPNSL